MVNRTKLLLMLILLGSLMLRFPTLYTAIIDIDESQYGEFAIKVVNGNLPYSSSIGEKPPLLYYYYIWIFKLFGKNNYYILHLITILWVMATVLIIYLIGKKRYSEKVGLVAALFYTIFSTTHEPKIISTNGETLMTLPLVLGIYFFTLYEIRRQDVVIQRKTGRLRAGKSKKWVFLLLAGLSTGFGFLFRHQAGMQIGFLGIYFFIRYVLLDQNVKSIKAFSKRVIEMSILVLGWLIPPLIAGYSMYLLGVFDDFIFWNFTFNVKYIQAGGQTISIKPGLIRVSVFVLFTLPAWYYLFKVLKASFPNLIKDIKTKNLDTSTSSHLFITLWLIFSSIPVFLGGRFYSHYFIQVFPPLFLLAGNGAAFLFEATGRRHPAKDRTSESWDRSSVRESSSTKQIGHHKKVITILIIYSVIFLLPRINQDLTKRMLGKVSPNAAKLGVYPEQKLVGEYIKKRTHPKDRIFVWGFATPIYVYANRECGSRFSWTDVLAGRIPGPGEEKSPAKSYIIKKAWSQFYEDMVKYKPVYFIDTAAGHYHEYGSFQISKYKKYKLPTFIRTYYRQVTTLSGMNLYKLKSKIPDNYRDLIKELGDF